MKWPFVLRSTMEQRLSEYEESLSRACKALAEMRAERDRRIEMKPRTIILECDELDYDTIQAEIAARQSRRDEHGPLLPDTESNLAGTVLAECIRDLNDYRDLFDKQRPAAG